MSQHTPLPSPSSSESNLSPFQFPRSHAFPPLYTLQPNPTTLLTQKQKWSDLITAYCAHYHLFTLTLPSCVSLPLFDNKGINRRLNEKEVREVVAWMCGTGSGEGEGRAEWIYSSSSSSSGVNGLIGGGGGGGKKMTGTGANKFYVFWRRVDEWADVLYAWVERTGQKGTVLTVWEMLEGEAARGEEFWGMDADIFQRALGVLVKRGKAQVFGEDEGKGVKFF